MRSPQAPNSSTPEIQEPVVQTGRTAAPISTKPLGKASQLLLLIALLALPPAASYIWDAAGDSMPFILRSQARASNIGPHDDENSIKYAK